MTTTPAFASAPMTEDEATYFLQIAEYGSDHRNAAGYTRACGSYADAMHEVHAAWCALCAAGAVLYRTGEPVEPCHACRV